MFIFQRIASVKTQHSSATILNGLRQFMFHRKDSTFPNASPAPTHCTTHRTVSIRTTTSTTPSSAPHTHTARPRSAQKTRHTSPGYSHIAVLSPGGMLLSRVRSRCPPCPLAAVRVLRRAELQEAGGSVCCCEIHFNLCASSLRQLHLDPCFLLLDPSINDR